MSSGYIDARAVERPVGRPATSSATIRQTGEKRGPGSGGRPDPARRNLAAWRSTTMRSRAIDRGCSIFTNSKRVWRTNTRGDYWVLDRGSHELQQARRRCAPASLMHAKFAPSGLQVGLRARKQHLRGRPSRRPDHQAHQFDLGRRDQRHIRLGLRGRVRPARRVPLEPRRNSRSPTGNWIRRAFREFPLVNNTDSLYPRITPIKYPKVGEKNAACRVGVVSAAGGETQWLDVPGDPRDNYIAYMEWAGNSDELVLQQLNRHQNTVRVMLADMPRTRPTVVAPIP